MLTRFRVFLGLRSTFRLDLPKSFQKKSQSRNVTTPVKIALQILPLFFIGLLSGLANETKPAESRTWKNASGNRTIEARFMSRDSSSITLLRSDQQVLTFDISHLHQDEQDFLDREHPYTPQGDEPEPQGDAFGPLQFGDSRKEVEQKLLDSPLVKTKANDGLFGRTGLNGIFETTEKIGNLSCYLYFGWTDNGGLNEVTLRTKALPQSVYATELYQTWEDLLTLLGKLYGKPTSQAPYPQTSELQDGLLLSSHLWRTSDGHSVLLGTGQEQKDYNVNVRFTTKRVQPIVIP